MCSWPGAISTSPTTPASAPTSGTKQSPSLKLQMETSKMLQIFQDGEEAESLTRDAPDIYASRKKGETLATASVFSFWECHRC